MPLTLDPNLSGSFLSLGYYDEARAAYVEFDPAEHPRGEHGRFTTKEQIADLVKFREDQRFQVPRTYEQMRDKLIEQEREHFANRDRGSPLWRFEHGLSWPYDDNVLKAFTEGDHQAMQAVIDHAWTVASRSGVEDVNPVFADEVQQAVDMIRENDALNAVFDEIGGLPSGIYAVTGDMNSAKQKDWQDLPDANFDEQQDQIQVFDTPRQYDVEGFYNRPLQGPLAAGSWFTRDDTAGVIQHELGHFVHQSLSNADQKSWGDAVRAGDPKAISEYADTNPGGFFGTVRWEGEAFAETFTAVMSPDFDRTMFSTRADPLLDWMIERVGEENVGKGV